MNLDTDPCGYTEVWVSTEACQELPSCLDTLLSVCYDTSVRLDTDLY